MEAELNASIAQKKPLWEKNKKINELEEMIAVKDRNYNDEHAKLIETMAYLDA